MTSRILPACAAFATLTLFSCYPYPESPPHGQDAQQQKPGTSVSDQEQQKIAQQRDRMKKAAADREQADRNDGPVTNPDSLPKPPAERKTNNIPTAQPVPGKEGFVFSPFNNKVIDVRDLPSGQLVADPTYPASEKKHFRVP